MLLKAFSLHAPKRLESALQTYASLQDVKLLAGGTFLLNNLKTLKRKGAKTPRNILSLDHIPELKGISDQGGHFIIRAMTTIEEIYHSSLLAGNLVVLRTAAKNISSQLIRNMATLGGNLTCRYTWTEMPAVMIALEARMHFMGIDGKEEIIPAEDFFRSAAKTDKIFTHVSVRKDKDISFVYFRAKKTLYVDLPLFSLCIKTRLIRGKLSETIVAVNNCVAFAQRDRKLENFLNGNRAEKDLGEMAMGHLDESIYDARGTDYKKHMFRVGIKHALRDLAGKRS